MQEGIPGEISRVVQAESIESQNFSYLQVRPERISKSTYDYPRRISEEISKRIVVEALETSRKRERITQEIKSLVEESMKGS